MVEVVGMFVSNMLWKEVGGSIFVCVFVRALACVCVCVGGRRGGG